MLYATVRQRKIHVKNPTTVIQHGVGVDQLVLDMDEEWKDMTSIVCVFTMHYKEISEETKEVQQEDGETKEETVTVVTPAEVKKQVLHTFGQPIPVPWECLVESGQLSVSCTGYVGTDKVMTTMAPDSFWTIVQNGDTQGDATLEATPSLQEQVLAAAIAANAAADRANNMAEALLLAREAGEFQGEKGDSPVRGVDYWTEADREAVIGQILAEFPVYNGEVV